MEDGGLTNCSWPESCLEKDGVEDKCNVCIMAFKGNQTKKFTFFFYFEKHFFSRNFLKNILFLFIP